MWTVKSVKMSGARLWVLAATFHAVLMLTTGSHHRRSMPTQASFPSKGGWRPVLGSGGLVYGSFGTAPLHAPYQVPIQDSYGSSSRPHVTRDVTKLTSIAQSYRPTTHRSVSQHPGQSLPQSNQPINSYHNPFQLNNGNNGATHYKYVQNFPVESVLIRNPHNPYAARPVYQKYPNKVNKPNLAHQQLSNLQPIHFGQYQTNKPFDIYGKQDVFGRPTETKKPTSASTEIFKPEVYKLSDSETAQQSLNQQIKTVQQSLGAIQKKPISPYANYAFQDSVFPPSILGTFGSFGVQSLKGRDPVYPSTKPTYIPSQPTKQTIFNSFSYSPYFKTTSSVFPSTTPKLQPTVNHIHFGTSFNDYKHIPTQQTKLSTPPKLDPNAGTKIAFKASPQDPFAKTHQNLNHNNPNTVTTYNPTVPTTTLANNNYYQDYNVQHHQNAQSNYYNQQNINQQNINQQNINGGFHYEKKKNKIHDSLAAGVNHQNSQQYALPPDDKFQIEATPDSVPFRATYEVTEHYDPDDIVTHSSPAPWTVTSDSYDKNKQRFTEETVTKQDLVTAFGIPSTTHVTDLPEELAIVTEGEKGYENSLSYDNQLESQSRRPLGDDFEPIGKHKLKDYYYKVSTPAYEEHHTRRTKKPSTQASRPAVSQEVTTQFVVNQENNDIPIETLPTLPPNRHFKRPSPNAPDAMDKDRIRKRNKNRRRRPPLANINRDKEETSTRRVQSTTEAAYTTESDDHTFKPRVRPSKPKQPAVTIPTTTNELTTSGVPTSSPTTPVVVKKKIGQRRQTTTTDKAETTTQYISQESNRDSPIMKISNRPYGKSTSNPYEYKTSETPDYTHKQDEKDTPTSDTDVIPDTLRTTAKSDAKGFSFHRDMKPIDQKETTTETFKYNDDNSVTETTIRIETSSESSVKIQRPRLKNKYENSRPRFSVKDYRNRLSSTTSTTEKAVEAHAPKIRFPQRRIPYNENKFNSETDNATDRKKFTPKDPRHKGVNGTEMTEPIEKEIHSLRQPNRPRQTTVETTEVSTPKISARIRNGSRRKTTTTEEPITSTVHNKRPLRKKIKDSDIGESVQDITISETTAHYGNRDETSERTRSESAIMKIADKKQKDHSELVFEHSKRVSDLTLAASKDYNTPGMFKTVASNSRRIPNYFTIATDDPILPIEAFFPQLNQKKET